MILVSTITKKNYFYIQYYLKINQDLRQLVSNKYELAMYNFLDYMPSLKTINGLECFETMLKEDNPSFTWSDVSNMVNKNKQKKNLMNNYKHNLNM